jgi:hypothetical protein
VGYHSLELILNHNDDDDDDDDNNKPVWPRRLGLWALAFRGARRTHINRVCFHITPPSLRSQYILVKGRKLTVICQYTVLKGVIIILIIIIIKILIPILLS